MKKCLFLVCLCLVPFVVFSSTLTSQNPIELPSDDNPALVLDTNGNPLWDLLETSSSYRIISTGRGAAGGDVYLGPSPNSSAPCDDGVFRYNSDVGSTGTPIGFISASNHFGPAIFQNQDINIVFHIPVYNHLCIRYAFWKAGNYDVSLGVRLLETGGTIRQEGSSWFRIVKASLPAPGYNLLYCPGPFDCPSCPVNQCQSVGEVIQDGKRRLALVKNQPLRVNFRKF